MRELTILLIIACLFNLMNSDCTPSEEELERMGKIRDFEDCQNRLSTAESLNNGYRCCYIYYYFNTNNIRSKVHSCIVLTQENYNNIDNFADNFAQENRVEDLDIDCHSLFHKLKLLASIFLFLY